jgi:hypothetical protein
VDAKTGLDVICAMAGNNSNIIPLITALLNVNSQIVEKVPVHVIIQRKKKESLITTFVASFLSLFQKIELCKEFLKTT